MPHQSLNGSKVIPVVQKGRGESMPHDVGMHPFLDQCLFYHGFDEAVNTFVGKPPFLVGSVFSQCLEEGMVLVCAVPGRISGLVLTA
jgi:hypothetical protein